MITVLKLVLKSILMMSIMGIFALSIKRIISLSQSVMLCM